MVKYATRKTLAGALGLSAGVMVFVSFAEILSKSNDAFVDAGNDENTALLLTHGCFFLGVFLMVVLNYVVHNLLTSGFHGNHHKSSIRRTNPSDSSLEGGQTNNDHQVPPVCPCDSPDPAAVLEKVHNIVVTEHVTPTSATVEESERPSNANDKVVSEADKRRLVLMSINTAAAIALHNFPEGLATFVATLHDPTVGLVLALAIAIHNIPEGLCVAMPVYYATGSRLRAFGWALLSGISEPLAAFCGWLVLANRFTDTLYGILFGIVSGMMVIISVRELLPTAHRYDPDDSVVTYTFILGMVIMSLSLVLFVV